MFVFSSNKPGVQSYSSQCIYVVWSLCDVINNALENCQFVGTTTLGCDESLEHPSDGGGCTEANISANVVAVSEPLGFTTSEIAPNVFNFEQQWRCVKGNSWGLYATTKGKMSRLSTYYDTWQWDELSHAGIDIVGVEYFGNITYSQGNAVFNPGPGLGIQATYEKLDFRVTFTPVINCVPLLGPVVGSLAKPPYSIPYTSYCGFNAKLN